LSARLDTSADAITRAAPAVLRVTAGLLWLSNVSWKVPPDFGESADGCGGLCAFVQAGIDNPVAPVYPWVLEALVRPNLAVFGWAVLVVEFLLAALLLSGTFTRAAAVVGFGQSIAIGLSIANAPGEWYWSYGLMAALHLAVFATAVGRRPTLDARRRTVVAGLVAAYGLIVVVANVNNVAGTDFTSTWVLFGGATDFPGDFGRNVFAGSIVLGIVLVVLAAGTWLTAGRPAARVVGLASALVGLVLLVAYSDGGNLLGAKPSSAAVFFATGLFLLAAPASMGRDSSTPSDPVGEQTGVTARSGDARRRGSGQPDSGS
jgi:uncharacterized membrane protein YphA (DoxX/SURF4 family)